MWYLPSHRSTNTRCSIVTELVAENAISPFQAILWCFYPVGAIVFVELFLRAMNGDDDDDDEGGGVMTPVYQGA